MCWQLRNPHTKQPVASTCFTAGLPEHKAFNLLKKTRLIALTSHFPPRIRPTILPVASVPPTRMSLCIFPSSSSKANQRPTGNWYTHLLPMSSMITWEKRDATWKNILGKAKVLRKGVAEEQKLNVHTLTWYLTYSILKQIPLHSLISTDRISDNQWVKTQLFSFLSFLSSEPTLHLSRCMRPDVSAIKTSWLACLPSLQSLFAGYCSPSAERQLFVLLWEQAVFSLSASEPCYKIMPRNFRANPDHQMSLCDTVMSLYPSQLFQGGTIVKAAIKTLWQETVPNLEEFGSWTISEVELCKYHGV